MKKHSIEWYRQQSKTMREAITLSQYKRGLLKITWLWSYDNVKLNTGFSAIAVNSAELLEMNRISAGSKYWEHEKREKESEIFEEIAQKGRARFEILKSVYWFENGK